MLDTGILLRIGLADTVISPSLRQTLLKAPTLLVSPITRSEIGIKVSVGKLTLPIDEGRFWREIVKRLQATELSYNCEHAALLADLPLLHRDPFDRMLVAQCLAEDLHFATTDEIFADYGVKTVG